MVVEDRDREAIRAYAEAETGETVVHLEKVASELVGPARHDIWDVICPESRWWIVTNPTFLYSQADFKSRDVVLSFHIGLMLRTMYLQQRDVPVAPQAAQLLPGSWRRWQQAFEAYEGGDEAEDFQTVGMRLRECLLSFIGEACSDELVPDRQTPPKAADFKAWIELLANHLARGDSASRLRSYLKKTAGETWDLTSWLTHAKSATRLDAEIALKAVEHVLGTFTAARMRFDRLPRRCESCGSYGVVAGECSYCAWVDPDYEPPPEPPRLSDQELARRLAEPCTPSSDISTFLSPRDVRK